jgi:selenocysteine lyase/cysteine desulfurase
MTTTRRSFLGALGAPVLCAAALNLNATQVAAQAAQTRGPDEDDDYAAAARDEAFWGQIATAFTVDRSLIHLNNGGVSPAPAFVQNAMKRRLDQSNEAPSRILWQYLEPQRENVRQRLALQWGVDSEEIALTRNASESLQICQFGIDLAPGDEILTTDQDYPRMRATFRQRARREGVRVRLISLPVPAESDDEVVQRFADAITDRTRMILVSHMINLTGQILPVARVVALGREHNILVIIDGAHAFAHVPFKLADLDCDYYGTSLHKWLFAPHGTGLLYVRRDKIRDLWPLMAADEVLDDDIRKFEEIGTHPAANELYVGEALTFNQTIGFQRKAARMVYLRDYWADPLLTHDRVRLHTSRKPGYACGIATVQIEGVNSGELTSHLWRKHKIIVTPIVHEQFEGIRVSPSVYTIPPELDLFVEAMEDVVRNGVDT